VIAAASPFGPEPMMFAERKLLLSGLQKHKVYKKHKDDNRICGVRVE
jgi:hypothetical protein